MRQARSRFLAAGCGLLLIALSAVSAFAGTGRVRTSGSTKLLDFCVSVQFNATPAELANIQRAFTDASALLADATDGQFAFGRVDIVNDSGAGMEAEVWIKIEAGRAYGTCGLYGVPGEHITMYYPSNFTATPAADGDAYTLAHEFGHHVWGIKDEYAGPGGAADCEAKPGGPSTNFSLMDNYFSRGGNDGQGTGTYTLNELCVAANHDPDHDTGQDSKWGSSCWERLAAHPTRPAVLPPGFPTDAPPAVPAPVFRFPAPERRFVLLIDRSDDRRVSGELPDSSLGLRGTPDLPPRQFVASQQAARLFVDLLEDGDQLAVISFAGQARVDFPLTTILTPADRDAAKAAIDSLSAGGGTAIGKGLASAHALLAGQPLLACSQNVLLMTDGVNNRGPGELTVVPDLIDAGIAVFAFGLAEPADPGNLEEIADRTGGLYLQPPMIEELPALVTLVAAQTTGGGVVNEIGGVLTTGGTFPFDVFIECGTTRATFLVFWPNLGDDIDLTVQAPDGTVYTAADAPGNPDIDFISSPGTEILTIQGATLQCGFIYTIVPNGSLIIGDGGSFCLSAVVDNDAVSIAADTGQPQFGTGESIQILATPRYRGNSVVGSTVTGDVVLPDGSTSTVTLFDDGNPANGDDEPGDGVYGGLFGPVSQAGVYGFEIDAQSAGAMTYGGESLFATVGHPVFSEPVPDFTRRTNIAAIVTNTPDGAPPVVTCPPPVDVDDGSVPVTLTAEVLDPDADLLEVTWLVDDVVVQVETVVDTDVPVAVSMTRTYAPGTHFVRVIAGNRSLSAECTTTVTVAGPAGPQIAVTLSPEVLERPDRSLRRVEATVDVSGGCTDWVIAELTSVTSDEPDAGLDERDLPNDIQGVTFGTKDYEFLLRAERDLTGDGRTYTVVYTAIDSCGNTTEGTAYVTVPPEENPGGGRPVVTGEGSDVSGRLFRPVPNPFHGESRVAFSVTGKAPVPVRITVYDVSGRRVRTLAEGLRQPGVHEAVWDGRDESGRVVPAGIYLYRMRIGDVERTLRTVRLR